MPLSRRLLIGATLATPFLGLAAAHATKPVPDPSAAPPTPEPQVFQLTPKIRLHAIQTGWVAVKSVHRRKRGPDATRFPAIFADPRWTEWLPILAWVIEHPEGLIVVDTGETARMLDPEYANCDPGNALFYNRNLRVALTEADEIGPQMRRAGLDPDAVGRVIMTHLHSDHMGGMGWFPRAEFLISETDFGGHLGTLTCRIPNGLNRTPVRYGSDAVGPFAASHAVTADGSVCIVPTPGHTPGHQSVRITDGRRSWLLGGDAAFTLDQVQTGQIAGVVAEPRAARNTLATLRDEASGTDATLLFTHDPGIVLSRT
ncbi:MAG: N-acyl homoserine lactonase family protein [Paracoccaceae bacterium]